MPRPKQVPKLERKTVTVVMHVVPYVGITFENPELSGTTAVGRDLASAISNARAEYRRRFPANEYDIEEKRFAT